MKLGAYLEKREISVAAFARTIGVESRMTMLRYVRGERIPPREIMAKIVAETGGKVRPNDFFDEPSTRPAA